MAKEKQKKGKLPIAVQRLLQLVSSRLTLERCAAKEETKNDIKLFLDTWVKNPIDMILAYDRGEESAAALLQHLERTGGGYSHIGMRAEKPQS